jgi:glucosamine--fructose-6-phosphate aminotransferase (isomerizing)
MCAIFGYIARKNAPVNIDTLAKIVRGNIHRGPHSFGFAWIDSDGRLRCFKQRGRLADQLGILSIARNARTFIGHLRFATHGSPEENINNHPHPADGGWFVHNGVIRNYESIIRRNGLFPVSECDSEVIGQMIECGDGSLIHRCADAIEVTEGSLAMLGLWARPTQLIVARRGNPLLPDQYVSRF